MEQKRKPKIKLWSIFFFLVWLSLSTMTIALLWNTSHLLSIILHFRIAIVLFNIYNCSAISQIFFFGNIFPSAMHFERLIDSLLNWWHQTFDPIVSYPQANIIIFQFTCIRRIEILFPFDFTCLTRVMLVYFFFVLFLIRAGAVSFEFSCFPNISFIALWWILYCFVVAHTLMRKYRSKNMWNYKVHTQLEGTIGNQWVHIFRMWMWSGQINVKKIGWKTQFLAEKNKHFFNGLNRLNEERRVRWGSMNECGLKSCGWMRSRSNWKREEIIIGAYNRILLWHFTWLMIISDRW